MQGSRHRWAVINVVNRKKLQFEQKRQMEGTDGRIMFLVSRLNELR